VRKVLPVRLIHLLEVGHVVQEHVDLDNALDGAPGLGEDRLDVLAALSGLVTDVTFNELAIGGAGDLARDVDCAACYYRLGL
jgi:hypothetical protein